MFMTRWRAIPTAEFPLRQNGRMCLTIGYVLFAEWERINSVRKKNKKRCKAFGLYSEPCTFIYNDWYYLKKKPQNHRLYRYFIQKAILARILFFADFRVFIKEKAEIYRRFSVFFNFPVRLISDIHIFIFSLKTNFTYFYINILNLG